MLGTTMEFPVWGSRSKQPMLIRLGPFSADQAITRFIDTGHMQQHDVNRYLDSRHRALTAEDERRWYEAARETDNMFTWGIWVQPSRTDEWKLIGTSELHSIGGKYFRSGVTGSMISDTNYWRKRIAGSCHRVRTWFAFTQLNITQLRSAAVHHNQASIRGLQRSGYVPVGTQRNTQFSDGQFGHLVRLECINPDPEMWLRWWHGDMPPSEFVSARQRTLRAMDWAAKNVTFTF